MMRKDSKRSYKQITWMLIAGGIFLIVISLSAGGYSLLQRLPLDKIIGNMHIGPEVLKGAADKIGRAHV